MCLGGSNTHHRRVRTQQRELGGASPRIVMGARESKAGPFVRPTFKVLQHGWKPIVVVKLIQSGEHPEWAARWVAALAERAYMAFDEALWVEVDGKHAHAVLYVTEPPLRDPKEQAARVRYLRNNPAMWADAIPGVKDATTQVLGLCWPKE